jgi:hypothetical protein
LDKHAHFTAEAPIARRLKLAGVAGASLLLLLAGAGIVRAAQATGQVIRPSCSMRWVETTASVELVGQGAAAICSSNEHVGSSLVAAPVSGPVVCTITREGVDAIVHDSSREQADGHLMCALLTAARSFK